MKESDISSLYLTDAKRLFTNYKSLAEKAIEQLTEEQLFYMAADGSNSIAIIIKHMQGNMLSRWTDFLTSDGEKEWRNRDREFKDPPNNKEALLKSWENGWHCLFTALNNLTTDDLGSSIHIRNEAQSVVKAINRQLAHYSYHVGQIVFLSKMLVGKEWNSLSIRRNQSLQYNADMKKKHT